MTTGKRAVRTKLDFRCPICRCAIGQASCLICASSSTNVPVLLLNQPNSLMRTATVQDIITVYEKVVYAPVTRSGTILINDVHTSCYFDVLSHKLSQRAMAVPRALYHVSPGILRWINGLGEKDGFPGWCRLAHKILT